MVIARRLVQLVMQLRQGSAGSRLHTRLVLLFSGVAVTPAIIVVIFSVFFLSSGLENWFSERVKNALDNSLAVAQAYLQEHKENIRADALAMAADLNRESASLDFTEARLRQVVDAQAALRSLTEAIVFDGSGRVLARTGLSFTMEVEQIPADALREGVRRRGGRASPATPTTGCAPWSGSTDSATPTCSSAVSSTPRCWATWSAPRPWSPSISACRASARASRSPRR